MKKFFAVILLMFAGFSFFAPVWFAQKRFDTELTKSTERIAPLVLPNSVDEEGTGGLMALIRKILQYLMPIFIALGIAIVLFGGYKIMSSNKEDALKEGGQLVLYGVIGIIVMSSARFLTNTLVTEVINIDGTLGSPWLDGVAMAERLYEKIFLPFLKIAVYLAMGVLFFILAGRVFTFLTSQDEGVRKKAVGMISWTVIWILVILAAKQLVEAVFGDRTKVINENATTLGEIGSGIFESQNIPIIYQVINRVMTLTAFVVLVLIIFQTFQMLTKPDDAEMPKKIRKTLIYVVIGILVIGAGYVISNVLLIN